MILHAFRDKFIRLAKDEDGVALVVTLAVFFFIYLVCMGVYAVGTNVRERIHLQNACDAAAYSAAVVQADTLSRIATINRAMSWTYVQMTRRQMDYIVYKWLKRTLQEYRADMRAARGALGACPHHAEYWDIAPDDTVLYTRNNAAHIDFEMSDKVSLNYTKHVSTALINEGLSDFLSTNLGGLSYFGRNLPNSGLERLGVQIDADKKAIDEMNKALDIDAGDSLPNKMLGHVEDTVEEILRANVDSSASGTLYFLDGSSGYFEFARNMDDEESRFLLWSGYNEGAAKAFETGHDTWFHRDRGDLSGFYREYEQGGALTARWHWKSWKWICHQPYADCTSAPVGFGDGVVTGSDVADSRFKGRRAKPILLKSEYFNGAGTISVGLAKKSENPLARMLGALSGIGGIFSAFNPFGLWTVALSSAKAGYAHNIPDDDGRNYWVSYKRHWRETDQPLNMSQSNWDAVHVPVRMAKVMADGRDWPAAGTGNKKPQWHAEQISGHIEEWMSGEWRNLSTGAVSDESPQFAYAGGTVDQKADFDRLEAESGRQWYAWGNTPTHLTNEGDSPVRVKWQIGNPGKNVNWGSLTERIFH